MNNETQTYKTIGYAYAGSEHATLLGRRDTGAYYVATCDGDGLNVRPAVAVNSLEAARRLAALMPEDLYAFSL